MFQGLVKTKISLSLFRISTVDFYSNSHADTVLAKVHIKISDGKKRGRIKKSNMTKSRSCPPRSRHLQLGAPSEKLDLLSGGRELQRSCRSEQTLQI